MVIEQVEDENEFPEFETIKGWQLVYFQDGKECYTQLIRAFHEITITADIEITVSIFREVWEPTWRFDTLMALVMIAMVVMSVMMTARILIAHKAMSK